MTKFHSLPHNAAEFLQTAIVRLQLSQSNWNAYWHIVVDATEAGENLLNTCTKDYDDEDEERGGEISFVLKATTMKRRETR